MTFIKLWIESNQGLLLWIGVASLVLFIVTLAALPFIVAQLPEDYFIRRRRHSARRDRKYPLFWTALAVAQNALGVCFVLAGMAMLLLPGQGLITILIGIALTNFPGKYTLERRIIRKPVVARSLNRIRELAGRGALKIPSAEARAETETP